MCNNDGSSHVCSAGSVTLSLSAQKHLSFLCCHLAACPGGQWLTLMIQRNCVSARFLNLWMKDTAMTHVKSRPPFRPLSRISEKHADEICVVSVLALFYRVSVSFMSLSFGAPPFLCVPLSFSLPVFCRSSIFTSFPSPDTAPS